MERVEVVGVAAEVFFFKKKTIESCTAQDTGAFDRLHTAHCIPPPVILCGSVSSHYHYQNSETASFIHLYVPE